MKQFIKMTLATLTGLILFGFVACFLMIGAIGSIAALSESKPTVPAEAVLSIDFAKMTLAEQTKEADPGTTHLTRHSVLLLFRKSSRHPVYR